jgi:hypothetical protein
MLARFHCYLDLGILLHYAKLLGAFTIVCHVSEVDVAAFIFGNEIDF